VAGREQVRVRRGDRPAFATGDLGGDAISEADRPAAAVVVPCAQSTGEAIEVVERGLHRVLEL
jgi:hypothetical protein